MLLAVQPTHDVHQAGVVATDEVTAEDLAVHTCPVLHLISLRPRLAGLSPLPQIQAGAALELLFPASGDIAASR